MTLESSAACPCKCLLVHLSATGEEDRAAVAGASLALYALNAGGDPLNPGDYAPYPAEAP